MKNTIREIAVNYGIVTAYGYRELDLGKLLVIAEFDRKSPENTRLENNLCKQANVTPTNHYGFKVALLNGQNYYILFEDEEVWLALPYEL